MSYGILYEETFSKSVEASVTGEGAAPPSKVPVVWIVAGAVAVAGVAVTIALTRGKGEK